MFQKGNSSALENASRDLLNLLILVLAMALFVVLPFINPPTKKDSAKATGNIMVTIHWIEGDYDVDLHVQGPGDKEPVYFLARAGEQFNLLRDDRGKYPDSTNLNYENAVSRGIVPGPYIVNVRCYVCKGDKIPVNITVDAMVSPTSGTETLFITDLVLMYEKDEQTAVRFNLDEKGRVIAGSVTTLFKTLVTDALLKHERSTSQ